MINNSRTDRPRSSKLVANIDVGVDACGVISRSVGQTNRKQKYDGHLAYKMRKKSTENVAKSPNFCTIIENRDRRIERSSIVLIVVVYRGGLCYIVSLYTNTAARRYKHLVTFAVIVSYICTAHAQKRLFMHFRCKFRHRSSIRGTFFLNYNFNKYFQFVVKINIFHINQ